MGVGDRYLQMGRFRTSPRLIVAGLLLGLFFLVRPSWAAPTSAIPDEFQQQVKPVLRQFCYRCHGGEKTKGDVNLTKFENAQSVERDPKLWRTVMEKLRERDMPPDGKPQPSEIDRQRIVNWVHMTLSTMQVKVKNPGRVTIHRLNRAEYNNTIRDLLGVDSHPADLFPVDGAGGEGFDNDADTLFIPTILMEDYLKAADDVLKQAKPDRFIKIKPGDSVTKEEAARKDIAAFATHAFRRPVDDLEVDPFVRLFDHADHEGKSFEDSMRFALKGVLVSPRFLFRLERDRDTNQAYRIDDFELATRLSYFLWSSMPDDELFAVAKVGDLHEPAVLEKQVRRMLQDPKAKAIGEQFGTEWLQIRELKSTVQPDRRRYPQYTPAVRDAMYDEAVDFVNSVFAEDKSLLTLLDSDYTFVNRDLAHIYGIDGIKGQDMQRVELTSGKRGGVLSMGAVLTVTSYPLRTSPVLRGKWVLEAILGAPPAPPPPDAGKLPADDRNNTGLTLRQTLEKHRANPQCASCHNRLDPLGFGLENFDAIGRWRDTQAGEPVDAKGVLLSGETFSGPSELKKVLMTGHKDEFIRNLTEKMLAYALGRGPEFYDQPTIDSIVRAVESDDCKSSRLVLEIAKSYPFEYRQARLPARQEASAQP